MKILDRYILKHFVQNFFFGIFCFLIIFILIDLFENLDKFIDKKMPGGLIFQYYIYFIPEILKLITPVGMLLASLFTISRFINYSELTAMQSSGISLFRYLAPILGFGLLITAFSIYFNGWVVPKSNSLKFNLERTYLGKHQIVANIQNLYIQEQLNRIITVGAFNESSGLAQNVSIQIFNEDTLTALTERYDIPEMTWDAGKKDWKLINALKRDFIKNDSIEFSYLQQVYIEDIPGIKKISLTPDLIKKSQLKPEELNLSEHKEFIHNLESSGLDASRTNVDYYSKISFPFANIVTILFGISVSTNRRKGGAALQFGIAILVSFIYLGLVKISQVIGYNGDINPILTAWMANILFIMVSIVNFLRLNRT